MQPHNATLALDRDRYLEPAPDTAATGGKQGLDPRFLTVDALQGLGCPTSPVKAIRAHCVECSGGSASEARKCTAIACPLWAFRMGVNVFHSRARKVKGGGGNA